MFLSGSISIECLLIFVFLFLLFILSVSLFKLYRREEVLPFSSLTGMCFYCRDLRNGDEFFSKNLSKALGKNSISDLEDFYKSFDDENKSLLVDIFSRIKDSYNYGMVKQGDISSDHIVFCNKKTNDIKYFICTYTHVVDPTTKILLKIFVFFHDVTNNINVLDDIIKENNSLKLELSHKNNILNALPFPVWVRDKNLKIKYFNTQFNYFFPHNQQYIGDLSFSRKEDEIARKALESQVMQVAELYVVINGKRHLYNFHEVPISGSNFLVGVGYGCEDKDRIRSELQRHIEAQSDLLESTASAVAIYGADTKLKFFNHAFVKMWGVEEKWLVMKPSYADFLNKLRSERKLPEQIDFQNFKNEQMNLFTDLTLTHNDFLYLPDGRSLRVIVIPHALGGLLFSYEDMTDRLALERSFNTLTAVQKSTIDHLNEGVTVFSEDGRLQVSNKQFANIWDISWDTLGTNPHLVVLIDKIMNNVQDVEKGMSFKDEFFLCVNSRETKNIRVKTKNDSVIDVLFVPLPDGATLVCYRDITDTMMIEQILVDKNKALQEADTLKTEFLANMSYELRSPLTSIIGFSGLLEGKHFGDLNKKQHEYVNAINDSSKYLMSLINDILDIASIEAGYMSLDFEKSDFKDAVDSVIELLSQRVKSKAIKLQISYSGTKFIGNFDVKRMKQVVFKMLNNAIGRSDNKSEVYISVRSIKGQYFALSIKDYGNYVSADDQERMFTNFYGVGKAELVKNKDNLGMSLVKSIVEMHGGRVSFLSKKGRCNILRAIVPLYNKELISANKVDNKSLAQQMVD